MGTGTGSEGLPWRPVTRRPHALQPPVLDPGAGPGLEQTPVSFHLSPESREPRAIFMNTAPMVTTRTHVGTLSSRAFGASWGAWGGCWRLGPRFLPCTVASGSLKGSRGQWELRPAACSVLRALPHAPFANLPLFPLQTCLIQNECSCPAMRKPGTEEETEAERGQGRPWRLQTPAVMLAVAAGPVVSAHASRYGESQRSLSSPQQKEPHSCPFSR